MKRLLHFLLEEITGAKEFTIEEKEEEGKVILEIKVNPDLMGVIIGKGGRTIKSIQNLVRVKGRLEDKNVFVNLIND